MRRSLEQPGTGPDISPTVTVSKSYHYLLCTYLICILSFLTLMLFLKNRNVLSTTDKVTDSEEVEEEKEEE